MADLADEPTHDTARRPGGRGGVLNLRERNWIVRLSADPDGRPIFAREAGTDLAARHALAVVARFGPAWDPLNAADRPSTPPPAPRRPRGSKEP